MHSDESVNATDLATNTPISPIPSDRIPTATVSV